jgi:hypothetical protein
MAVVGDYTAVGGSKVGTAALTGNVGRGWDYVGSGGSVLSGLNLYPYSVSGGIEAGGAAYITYPYPIGDYEASGGLKLGGTVNGSPNASYPAIHWDQISYSGEAQSVLYRETPYQTSGTPSTIYYAASDDIDGSGCSNGTQWLIRDVTGVDTTTFTLFFKIRVLPDCDSGYPLIFHFAESASATGSVEEFSYVGTGGSYGQVWVGHYYADGSYDFDDYTLEYGVEEDNWVRVLVQYDSTQATESDRLKVFFNGTQATYSGFPTQNEPFYNSNGTYNDYIIIAGLNNDMSGYPTWTDNWDGKLSDVMFVEGYIVDDADIDTYSGPFGTHGFKLGFTDSNANDSSGNDNHFTNGGSVPITFDSEITGITKTYSMDSLTTFTFGTKFRIPTLSYPEVLSFIFLIDNFSETGIVPNQNYLGIGFFNGAWKGIRVDAEVDNSPVFYVSTESASPISYNTDYYLLVLFDSNNATEANRVRIYIDGVLIAHNPYSSEPSQGADPVASFDSPTYYTGQFPAYGVEVVLWDTFFVPHILITPSELTLDGYPPIYGDLGWLLRYTYPTNFGIDSGPNNLDFTLRIGESEPLAVYDYIPPAIETTITINLQLDSSSTPETYGLPFVLYSGESVSPSVGFTINVASPTYSVPFSIYGSGESVSGLTVPFSLYKTLSLTLVDEATWSQKTILDSVDISAKVVKALEFDFEEDASLVATFVIAPALGSIDPLVYVGKPVEFWYQQYVSGTLQFERKYFSGFVADVEWDADRRSIKVSADTQMPAQFNAMTKEEIAAVVGGLYSAEVWADEDDKSGWTYAQERLSTTEDCLWHDADRRINVTSIRAKRSAGVIVPDFTFEDNERFHETLTLTYAQRSEMTNQINVALAYSYARKRHKEITFNWKTKYFDIPCAFLRWPGNWQLCQRSMVESAATSGTWIAISKIEYDPVWAAGGYDCPPPGGGAPGAPIGANVIIWNYRTISGFVNGEEVSVDPVTGEQTENEGFSYDAVVDASHLCNGARWRAAARWVQDVEENYDIVIKAPDSIEAIGVVATSEEYSLSNEIDYSDWENSVVPYGSEKPEEAKKVPGSDPSDTYVDGDEESADGSVNRDEFNDIQQIIIAAARGDILRAHRLTTVSFKVAFQPSVTLGHTVKVDTPHLTAAGKVKALKSVWDLETGEASTEITLAISRHNGSGIAEDTDIDPVEKPTPTEEEEFDSYVSLGTYIGGRLESPIYDETAQTEWEGFLTNYLDSKLMPNWSANPVLNPEIEKRMYPYSFIIRGPTIDESHTQAVTIAASQVYDVAIPEDDLTLSA